MYKINDNEKMEKIMREWGCHGELPSRFYSIDYFLEENN
jgi:hypothetical protein